MKIDHIAIWTKQLDKLKSFYVDNFSATVYQQFINPKTQYESYRLSFPNGVQLELMQAPDVVKNFHTLTSRVTGYSHLAFSVGSQAEVEKVTDHLRSKGCLVIDLPRVTGDGYYESIVLDPDGNRIEIKE
ncbi:glyoxalase/bleomycin resistance/extradiol dioxygenase family protein [bacterium]|nr:glyoxalase/bleomycin resistance/extradiol dioxygenase family protein [bacterium]